MRKENTSMPFDPQIQQRNATMTTFAHSFLNQRLTLRLLLACGAIGPFLYIIVFLIAGATRPGYSTWHNYISQLELGEWGWIQVASTMILGVLSLCFALGLRISLRAGKGSVWGPILFGLFGLCHIATGLFKTDPKGYSPGAQVSTTSTLHGSLHIVAATVMIISLVAACCVLARYFLGNPNWKWWAAYSLVTAIVVIVFYAASQSNASRLPGSPAGLLQRIAIIAGWLWMALFAIRLSIISTRK
jgi:hypothetical membrane protein